MALQTAEQIVQAAERYVGRANITAINRAYLRQDTSRLWPICSGFNVTKRAIRRVRKFAREVGGLGGLEYAYALEENMSEIVNNPKNWR